MFTIIWTEKDDLKSEKTLWQKCSKFKMVKVNFEDGQEFYVEKLILVVKMLKLYSFFRN